MSQPDPIACTLDSAEAARREREIRSLGREALLSAEREERRALLRFRAGDAVRRRVADIAAAEARCCPFLEFAVTDDAEATLLSIAAPPGGEPMLDALADALAGKP